VQAKPIALGGVVGPGWLSVQDVLVFSQGKPLRFGKALALFAQDPHLLAIGFYRLIMEESHCPGFRLGPRVQILSSHQQEQEHQMR